MEHPTSAPRSVARALALVFATVLLSGCALLPKQPEPPQPARYGEHHCYRTLAHVDCHSVALADEGTRREGWYEAPLED